MKIRILQGFRDYTPGQVFDDWPGGMCEILIARGLIEPVGEQAEVEAAEETRAVEHADASPKRKKK